MVKEFFKIVRAGTFEELIFYVNKFLNEGWYLQQFDETRTEFFQEHMALLVNENYLKHMEKYNSFLEDKIAINQNVLFGKE